MTELRDSAVGKMSERSAEPNDGGEVVRFAARLRGTRIEKHHLASTLLVPLRTIVLVGGISGTSDHAADQLYLFVEVAVQEPRPPTPLDPATADRSITQPPP